MIWHRLSIHSLLYACLALLLARGDAWALGSTPVTVVNPTDIAKAEGIQHPFRQEGGGCLFTGVTCSMDFTAPTNQRLVIEYVSGACGIDPGNGLILVQIDVVVGPAFNAVRHRLGLIDHFGLGGSVTFGQTVRLYADQGDTVSVIMQTANPNDSRACGVSLSGQAIDVP